MKKPSRNLRKLKAGKGFELLVRDIEKTAAHGKSWLVEAPMFRRDRTTGKGREFDVGITFPEGNHKLVQAFECRDRSRKIDVPAVEAFAAKCADCHVHRGVIVSARGFHKTAIAKARHLGIGCLTLEEARSFNWLLANDFGYFNRQLLESKFLLTTGNPEIDNSLVDVDVYDANGARVSLDDRKRLIETIFNKAPIPSYDSHAAELRAHIPHTPWFVKSPDEKLHPVPRAVLRMRYRATLIRLPIELRFYRDEETGKLLQEVASAPVVAEGRTLGRMVLTHDETGTSITFVRDQDAHGFVLNCVVEYIPPPEAGSA